MRFLNRYFAVATNKEDNCSEPFWESHFKSQALLDERALLTCFAYVNLNPISSAILLRACPVYLCIVMFFVNLLIILNSPGCVTIS